MAGEERRFCPSHRTQNASLLLIECTPAGYPSPTMKVAVLPFNAAEGTKPAYGRQFAAFVAEQLRAHAAAEINSVSYLTQVEQDGQMRTAYVNISDGLLPFDQLEPLFGQAEVEIVQDGFLEETDGQFTLTVRYHEQGNAHAIAEETMTFARAEIFGTMTTLIAKLAEKAQVEVPEGLQPGVMEFGTDHSEVFLDFLEGFDSLTYIQQSNGAVAVEFSPEGAFSALTRALEADPDFEGSYNVLVQLARMCTQFQIGSFEQTEAALKQAIAAVPDDAPGYFVLGELYQLVGQLDQASNQFEKAIQKEPNDPGFYNRLGIVQAQMQMFVNAERNFKKAMELEGPDKPSADFLAGVLQQTGREHEIPPIWKSLIDLDNQNASAHAKYAISLIQNSKKEEGERAFDTALELLEDNALVKRYYAPYLVEAGDLDRAMDFYEDALDAAPADIPTLLEYAQTLEKADREFEVPAVLKNILAANPDPNTRAQVQARLIELEQPKRVENVEAARAKMEEGDFEGALRDLKPLRNWLGDYWKLWALYASANNQLQQYGDAEEAVARLLELFPGCEPAFGELVTALVGQDRADDAYGFMRQVMQANSGSVAVAINYARAASAAGHKDEARELVKQLREAIGPNADLEPVFASIESF